MKDWLMTLGRFFSFAFLVFLAFTITWQAAAQNSQAPTRETAQSAGKKVQDEAARASGPVSDNAVQNAAPPRTAASVAQSASLAELRISGGDLVNISVYGVPELTQDSRVGNSGDVYLPLIGYVQLGGLTLDQAQTIIENRLREGEFVKNPHVTVSLKDYVNQSATVTGEVARPGVYPILGTRRLLEVLAAAGGLTQRAGKTASITHRDHPDEPVKVDIPADLAQSPQDNIEILPGDTLVVNRAGLVYVVGEVARPSGLIMDNNEKMTVMQAIALAGGPTPVAAMNSARLIRTTPTGREERPVPLNKILSTKLEDINLQPDDIIFVPASFGKKAASRSLNSILAVTQSLAIYHP
jgi:polysaccharide biosynthesis/export protein